MNTMKKLIEGIMEREGRESEEKELAKDVTKI